MFRMFLGNMSDKEQPYGKTVTGIDIMTQFNATRTKIEFVRERAFKMLSLNLSIVYS